MGGCVVGVVGFMLKVVSGCQLDEPQLLWQPPEEYICEMIL